MLFGNRIKELREAHNMKQTDLAEYLHVGRAAISNYELELRALDPELINQLCDIFHVSADYLLCRTILKNHQKHFQTRYLIDLFHQL